MTYYRGHVGSGQCGLIYVQRMYIDGCGGYSEFYGLPHGLEWYIRTNSIEIDRDTAKATESF